MTDSEILGQKIIDKIYRSFQKITLKSMDGTRNITSISISHVDFYTLMKCDRFIRSFDPSKLTFLGIKINITRKVTRVNTKWLTPRKTKNFIMCKPLMIYKNSYSPTIPMDFVYSQ